MDLKKPLKLMVEHYKNDPDAAKLEEMGIEVEEEIEFFEIVFYSVDILKPLIEDNGEPPIGVIGVSGNFFVTNLFYTDLLKLVEDHR